MTSLPTAHPILEIVSDGRAGMANQVRGLAEAMARQKPDGIDACTIRETRLAIAAPWRNLPGFLWGDPLTKNQPPIDLSTPPDIWIGCGRLSLPFARPLKARGVFVVQLQNPRSKLSHFDVVIPPRHDRLEGDNVAPMLGSPNRLTQNQLREDAARLLPFISGLPSPRIAVLIGGPSKAFRMSDIVQDRIMEQLQSLHDSGAGLMITTSRRTPTRLISLLREQFSCDHIFQWHGDNDLKPGFNPYFGMLGLADHILVTEESTNMITEAAFTGQSIHLLRLEGGNAKFARFHQAIRKAAIARPLELPLQSWTYPPLRETDRIANTVWERWLSHVKKTDFPPSNITQ